MMILKFASVGVVALATALSGGGEAKAFGDCTSECYTKVRTSAKYGYSERIVVMEPDYKEVREAPALYGVHRRKVMVKPARTIWVHKPAVSHEVSYRVMVSPATVKWVMKRDWMGRDVRCRVVVPGEYRSMKRTVWTNGRRIAIRKPAEYAWVGEKVLIKPARKQYLHHGAKYGIVRERVRVSPGHHVWVKH